MTTKLDWLIQEIDGLKAQGLYNRIRTIGSAQGARLIVDGKDVLNFCSNNYLGLANHPKVVEAAKQATKKYGVGPAAVRSIAGTTDLHVELERRLAKFKGAQDVITFQSGFTANLGTISALVTKEDVIFSDRLNHASSSLPTLLYLSPGSVNCAGFSQTVKPRGYSPRGFTDY